MSNVYLTVTENNLSIEQSGEPPRIDMVIASTGGGSSETPLTIKTKYESNTNTNAFTDAEKTKLADQTGVNTGDQDLSGIIADIATNETDISNNAIAITNKQDILVSGTNIKTINGTSLLESGDIVISGGSEFANDEFFIYDSINVTYKLNFDTSNLTASRTIKMGDFNFDLNNLYLLSGGIQFLKAHTSYLIFGSNLNTNIGAASNSYRFKINGGVDFLTSRSKIAMTRDAVLSWTSDNLQATAAVDTTIKRISAGVLQCNGNYNALGHKTGTLASPPTGLAIGDYWDDTTDSTTHPIVRRSTVAT